MLYFREFSTTDISWRQSYTLIGWLIPSGRSYCEEPDILMLCAGRAEGSAEYMEGQLFPLSVGLLLVEVKSSKNMAPSWQ